MRRIIERVVTVVTTTTWKISWEPDSSASDPSTLLRKSLEADLVSRELPIQDPLQSAPPGPIVIEAKEVDPPEKENAPDQA
jgi:hypothetical protein